MTTAFFSPDKLRALHQICNVLESGEEYDQELLVSTLIHTIDSNLPTGSIKKKGYQLRQQGEYNKAIVCFWGVFCAIPSSQEHIKLILEATHVYWKQHRHPEDLVAQRLMCRFLLLLYPEDEEGLRFSQTLPYRRASWATFFAPFCLVMSILFLTWLYFSLQEHHEIPVLPTLATTSKSSPLPPTWDTPQKEFLLVDQGSSFHLDSDGFLSYRLHLQLRNRSLVELHFAEVNVTIYDTSDQPICSEPLVLLPDSVGPVRPNDDLYRSFEMQCATAEQQIPNRVVIRIKELRSNPATEKPEELLISSYPKLPIRIYERETLLEALEHDFWLRKQLVIYNDDVKEKEHIVIRVHLYNEDDEFISIEERTIIAAETNKLPAGRHILHVLALRVSQEPTKMDIEIVEFE